jgi:hypothetical protein
VILALPLSLDEPSPARTPTVAVSEKIVFLDANIFSSDKHCK